jgi:hypothetical protein
LSTSLALASVKAGRGDTWLRRPPLPDERWVRALPLHDPEAWPAVVAPRGVPALPPPTPKLLLALLWKPLLLGGGGGCCGGEAAEPPKAAAAAAASPPSAPPPAPPTPPLAGAGRAPPVLPLPLCRLHLPVWCCVWLRVTKW